MDKELAYRKGWEASKRTTTYRLDAAEDRFARKYGNQFVGAFSDGWIDYASDFEYGESQKG